MKEYCLGFVSSASLVLLIEKTKPDWQAGKLNGIGGKIEDGETPLEAMKREWAEETGIDNPEWSPTIQMFEDDWVVYCFKGTLDGLSLKSAEMISETFEEKCFLVDANDLPDNVLPNLKWLVPMHQDEGFNYGIKNENNT